jgi:hypothetical protein
VFGLAGGSSGRASLQWRSLGRASEHSVLGKSNCNSNCNCDRSRGDARMTARWLREHPETPNRNEPGRPERQQPFGNTLGRLRSEGPSSSSSSFPRVFKAVQWGGCEERRLVRQFSASIRVFRVIRGQSCSPKRCCFDTLPNERSSQRTLFLTNRPRIEISIRGRSVYAVPD